MQIMRMRDQYRAQYDSARNKLAEGPLFRLALLHHANKRGEAMSYRDMPYLIEPMRDFPNIEGADAMKATQTGWSELFIMLQLERTGWSGRIGAYVLPTFDLRNRFVQTRVDPLLNSVPAYRALCPGGMGPDKGGDKRMRGESKGAANLRIKLFGRGTMLFLGSNTPNDFVEFSADCMIIDELDRCVEANLALARDRLRASPYPQLFRTGNPTINRVGIARTYARTDMRRWHHQCHGCGERQPLDWFQHVVRRADDGSWICRDLERFVDPSKGPIRPVCRKCNQPFDRVAKGGCWVAEDRTVDRRGYHISRMDVLSQSLFALYAEWLEAVGDTTATKAFYNSVLGIGYEPSGARLTVEDLDRVCEGPLNDLHGGEWYEDQAVVAGIDVGSVLNIKIAVLEDGVRKVVHVSAVRSFEQIMDLLRRFYVDVCVIDARPETRKAQELADEAREYGCVVWLCQFVPTDRVTRGEYGIKINRKTSVVSVDRTQLLDATSDDMRSEPMRIKYPQDCMSVPGWSDQMRANQRMLNDKGNRFIWSKGVDHYRFAEAYLKVADDLFNRGGSYHVV